MRNDVQKDTLEKFPFGTAASGSHTAADVAKPKLQYGLNPWPGKFHMPWVWQKKKKKKKKYTRMKMLVELERQGTLNIQTEFPGCLLDKDPSLSIVTAVA